MTPPIKKVAKARPQGHKQPQLSPKWMPTSTLSTMSSHLPVRPKSQTYPMAGVGYYTPQAGAIRMSLPIYRSSYQDHTQFMSRPMIQPMVSPIPSPQAQPEPGPKPSAPPPKAAVYEDEDPNRRDFADIVGTAAYYKSGKFKRKQAAGKVQVPGVKDQDEDVDMDDAKPEKPPSLIMIFGRDTVRRTTTKNKFYLRMQKYNKRS